MRACVRVCVLLYILDFFIETQAHDIKLIVGEGRGEMGGREDTCEEQGCCNV